PVGPTFRPMDCLRELRGAGSPVQVDMDKWVLFSIVAVTIIVPAVAATERSPRLALQKVLAWTLIGIFAYLVAVLFIYPRFLG
ncbi:MAG TPA: hypothetical protein VKB92_00285, partial [Myxococcales bacterium]|nr:hypothetical protein [Myxococcales bacterium]